MLGRLTKEVQRPFHQKTLAMNHSLNQIEEENLPKNQNNQVLSIMGQQKGQTNQNAQTENEVKIFRTDLQQEGNKNHQQQNDENVEDPNNSEHSCIVSKQEDHEKIDLTPKEKLIKRIGIQAYYQNKLNLEIMIKSLQVDRMRSKTTFRKGRKTVFDEKWDRIIRDRQEGHSKQQEHEGKVRVDFSNSVQKNGQERKNQIKRSKIDLDQIQRKILQEERLQQANSYTNIINLF